MCCLTLLALRRYYRTDMINIVVDVMKWNLLMTRLPTLPACKHSAFVFVFLFCETETFKSEKELVKLLKRDFIVDCQWKSDFVDPNV